MPPHFESLRLSAKIFAGLLLTVAFPFILPRVACAVDSMIPANSLHESGLIGFWKLDQVIDRGIQDSSGSGADCVLSGGVSLARNAGKFGPALEFYGRDGCLEARNSAKLNLTAACTISFWMKPSEWLDKYSPGIVSKKKSDKDRGFVIYKEGTRPAKITLRASGRDGAVGISSEASVDEDVWQHWAVTYEPTTKVAIWYKNGKPDKEFGHVTLGDMSNDTAFEIGYSQIWKGFYCGQLGDVKIFNRALPASDIEAEYDRHSAIVEVPAPLAPVPVVWRVIATHYPTADAVVAGCTVTDAGAKGDGKTDDTAAFERAMSSMAGAGGGTVFIPEGRYAIRGHLKVPTGVTLRGEWERPVAGVPVRGSVLMAYAGRGESEGRPFISLHQCSGIKELSVWYPEQDPGGIVAYPFCIKQLGGDSATVENVTLVNPFRGILIPGGSELHYLHNLYGSPLAIGLEVDFVSDLGRADNLHFSPRYWSDSGFPGAPPPGGPHATWMRANGTGLLFLRNEWVCSQFVTVSGYRTGLEILGSKIFGATNGELYDHRITDCGTAVKVRDANFAGTSFTKCRLEGDDYGVVTTPEFNSRLLFHTCDISGGKQAALLDGVADQAVLFEHCKFSGMVERIVGDLALFGCSINSSGEHLHLGKKVRAVSVAGTTYNGKPRIIMENASEPIEISAAPVPDSTLPEFSPPEDKSCAPARAKLFVVTEPAWGARKDGLTDDTAAIQKALDAAAEQGGGIVFLPGGEYALQGNLAIPTGVELRGVYDVPHHSLGKGSVLRIESGRGQSDGAPFITMNSRSGLRGVTFLHPGQTVQDIVPYPFTVRGNGHDIYVVNICAVNSYKMLDFMTHRCDRHYIEYAAGVALKTGISIGGGSVGGELLNGHLQTHYWNRSPFNPNPASMTGKRGRYSVWEYQHEHLDAFLIGNCRNETLYQDCVFGSRTGFHFIAQDGIGASACRVLAPGADGSRVSMAFDGLGPGGIDIVNSQLVSMQSNDPVPSSDRAYLECGEGLNSEVRLYNTTLWGGPNASARVNGGTLTLALASFFHYAPFAVHGGKLSMLYVTLVTPLASQPELDVHSPGRVSLFGTISPHGMRLGPDTPKELVSSLLENSPSLTATPGAR